MQSNFWAGPKKFGPAQNILGPVKGQGIIVFASAKIRLIISFFGHVYVQKFGSPTLADAILMKVI